MGSSGVAVRGEILTAPDAGFRAGYPIAYYATVERDMGGSLPEKKCWTPVALAGWLLV